MKQRLIYSKLHIILKEEKMNKVGIDESCHIIIFVDCKKKTEIVI